MSKVICEYCDEVAIATFVMGIYHDNYTPLCRSHSLDAVKNNEDWHHRL